MPDASESPLPLRLLPQRVCASVGDAPPPPPPHLREGIGIIPHHSTRSLCTRRAPPCPFAPQPPHAAAPRSAAEMRAHTRHEEADAARRPMALLALLAVRLCTLALGAASSPPALSMPSDPDAAVQFAPLSSLLESWRLSAEDAHDGADHYSARDFPSNLPPMRPAQAIPAFDFRSEADVTQARLRRDAAQPFLLRNVPSLLLTGAKWSDAYLRASFGSSPLPVDRAPDSHFTWFHQAKAAQQPQFKRPTTTTLMTFDEFATRQKKTITTRKRSSNGAQTQRDNNHDDPAEYLYLQLSAGMAPFLSDDLSPLFEESWIVDRSSDRSFVHSSSSLLQCRFGSPGLLSQAHFDHGDNYIGMLKGRKRYILLPPDQCAKLDLETEGPAERHSRRRWLADGVFDSAEFQAARALEVTLSPGDLLYLPAYWFHYIQSLDFTIQCNQRYRRMAEGVQHIRDCGFKVQLPPEIEPDEKLRPAAQDAADAAAAVRRAVPSSAALQSRSPAGRSLLAANACSLDDWPNNDPPPPLFCNSAGDDGHNDVGMRLCMDSYFSDINTPPVIGTPDTFRLSDITPEQWNQMARAYKTYNMLQNAEPSLRTKVSDIFFLDPNNDAAKALSALVSISASVSGLGKVKGLGTAYQEALKHTSDYNTFGGAVQGSYAASIDLALTLAAGGLAVVATSGTALATPPVIAVAGVVGIASTSWSIGSGLYDLYEVGTKSTATIHTGEFPHPMPNSGPDGTGPGASLQNLPSPDNNPMPTPGPNSCSGSSGGRRRMLLQATDGTPASGGDVSSNLGFNVANYNVTTYSANGAFYIRVRNEDLGMELLAYKITPHYYHIPNGTANPSAWVPLTDAEVQALDPAALAQVELPWTLEINHTMISAEGLTVRIVSLADTSDSKVNAALALMGIWCLLGLIAAILLVLWSVRAFRDVSRQDQESKHLTATSGAATIAGAPGGKTPLASPLGVRSALSPRNGAAAPVACQHRDWVRILCLVSVLGLWFMILAALVADRWSFATASAADATGPRAVPFDVVFGVVSANQLRVNEDATEVKYADLCDHVPSSQVRQCRVLRAAGALTLLFGLLALALATAAFVLLFLLSCAPRCLFPHSERVSRAHKLLLLTCVATALVSLLLLLAVLVWSCSAQLSLDAGALQPRGALESVSSSPKLSASWGVTLAAAVLYAALTAFLLLTALTLPSKHKDWKTVSAA